MDQISEINKPVSQLTLAEQANFLFTNRVPRQFLTKTVGRISRIENRLLTKILISIWKFFAPELSFEEAKKTEFTSLRDCFIRELKEGVRPIEQTESVIVSPCDAIIGEFGSIKHDQLYQAKGFPYQLKDLIPDATEALKFTNGIYITLRLKSSMYHRFHAPTPCRVEELTYISGDTWNVNPVALKKIEGLFCLNERAIVPLKPTLTGGFITLVPVAAILVASMKFRCLDQDLDIQYKGPNKFECDSNYEKGEEMGYFQHGSTIIMFASDEYSFTSKVKTGARVNLGEGIMSFTKKLTLMENGK